MEDPIKAVESSYLRRDLPELRPGDTVRVFVKVSETRINPKTKKPEEKVRLQAYEGVLIADRGGGLNRSIVVRKMSGGVGVERIFPLHSPAVERIEVIKRAKVRRAKLFYLRGRVGKHAKLKDAKLSKEELERVNRPQARAPEPEAETPAPAPPEDKPEGEAGDKQET